MSSAYNFYNWVIKINIIFAGVRKSKSGVVACATKFLRTVSKRSIPKGSSALKINHSFFCVLQSIIVVEIAVDYVEMRGMTFYLRRNHVDDRVEQRTPHKAPTTITQVHHLTTIV